MQLFRSIFRFLCLLYPVEHGKYTILQRIYFPFLAPKVKTHIIKKAKFGIKLKLNITEYIQSFIYNYGAYELPLIKLFKNIIKPGFTIIDIGGNIGYTSLIFSKFSGVNGKIISFEPEIDNYNQFLENIKLNGFNNIELTRKALSDKNTLLKLYLSSSNNSGTHSTILNKTNVSEQYEEIEAITLDNYVIENPNTKPDMIKIDVEGAEFDVLKGMNEVLIKHKPILVIELVNDIQTINGYQTSEIKKLLKDKYNYIPFLHNDKGYLHSIDIESEHNGDNVIFIYSGQIEYYKDIININ